MVQKGVGYLCRTGPQGASHKGTRPRGTGPDIFPDGQPWLDRNGTVIPRIGPDPVTPANIPDGASNTLLVGERNFNLARHGQSLQQYDENNGYFNVSGWDTIRWG